MNSIMLCQGLGCGFASAIFYETILILVVALVLLVMQLWKALQPRVFLPSLVGTQRHPENDMWVLVTTVRQGRLSVWRGAGGNWMNTESDARPDAATKKLLVRAWLDFVHGRPLRTKTN